LFLFASVTYLFKLITPPELTGATKLFMEGVLATGYFMILLKVTELLCGLAFVTGRYVALACVVITPIIINIFCFHLFVATSGVPVGIYLVVANSFLIWANFDKYRPMLRPK